MSQLHTVYSFANFCTNARNSVILPIEGCKQCASLVDLDSRSQLFRQPTNGNSGKSVSP